MMEPGFFGTWRGRVLAVLAAGALLSVTAATLAVIGEARRTIPDFKPAVMFPDLQENLSRVAAITLKNATGEITLRKISEDRWVVPRYANYPASAEAVRRVLLGLSTLKAVERRTSRRDWFGVLDLDSPDEGGKATAIQVRDEKNQVLAGVLIGKPAALRTSRDIDTYYARRSGENQSYVVEGDLPLEISARDWLQPSIVDIARERIKSATITPADGTPYRVSRDSVQSEDFALAPLPQGRKSISTTAVNSIGAALSELDLETVRLETDLDFTKAGRASFETFDGLVVAVDVIKQGEDSWIKIAASADKTAAEAVKQEAQAIGQRTRGWAYQVPAWKAELFTRAMDSLLASPEEAGN